MAWVYILRCGDGSLYTGITTDLERRLQQHQVGKASRYTRAHQPVELAWSREVDSWPEALREEHRLKRLTRTAKEALLAAVTTATRDRRREPGDLRATSLDGSRANAAAPRSGSRAGRRE